MSRETSVITGETPVLVNPSNDKSTFASILSNAGRNLVGFGADQVVIVRDDNVRNEIENSVGKHALILTISESKGLEFQVIKTKNYNYKLSKNEH